MTHTPEQIIECALEAGIMISTAHGQGTDKLMPVSDRHTLQTFAKLLAARGLLGAVPKKIDGLEGVTPVALEYFKPPFKYEPMGQTIYCEGANGPSMCLQVRGWGNLTGGGANNLPHEKAEYVQDEFGQWVCDAINRYAAMTKGDGE